MGKTKVPKLLAVSMPFNGMQTASYCNNTLQRTANVTSHRCNNSCDVQVYHELLQGQTYCMPMSHSLTRCRLTSGPNSRMRRFIVSKEARARRSSVGLKACFLDPLINFYFLHLNLILKLMVAGLLLLLHLLFGMHFHSNLDLVIPFLPLNLSSRLGFLKLVMMLSYRMMMFL